MPRLNIPSFIDLWQKHETLYVELFKKALEKRAIQNSISLDMNEDTISESLCPILSQLCFDENQKHKEKEIRIPDWEKPIQPKTEKELIGGKKCKRPDFTCSLINHYSRWRDLTICMLF